MVICRGVIVKNNARIAYRNMGSQLPMRPNDLAFLASLLALVE
jgi:hypothetical protein